MMLYSFYTIQKDTSMMRVPAWYRWAQCPFSLETKQKTTVTKLQNTENYRTSKRIHDVGHS